MKAKIEFFNNFIKKALTFRNAKDAIYDVLKIFCETFDFDNASIFILNEKKSYFYMTHSYGVNAEQLKDIRVPAAVCSYFSTALRQNRVIIRDKTYGNSLFKDNMDCLEDFLPKYCVIPIGSNDKDKMPFVGVIAAGFTGDKGIAAKSAFSEIGDIMSEYLEILLKNAVLLKDTYEKSITDQLTGIYNHGFFFETLSREAERIKRYDKNSILGIIDIDNYKQINDKYGHIIGDRVLRIVANLIQSSLRKSDIIARYGGDEFIILLTETNKANGTKLFERLRNTVKDFAFGDELSITISIGAIELNKETMKNTDVVSIVRQADLALYSSKNSGKNQLTFANRAE